MEGLQSVVYEPLLKVLWACLIDKIDFMHNPGPDLLIRKHWQQIIELLKNNAHPWWQCRYNTQHIQYTTDIGYVFCFTFFRFLPLKHYHTPPITTLKVTICERERKRTIVYNNLVYKQHTNILFPFVLFWKESFEWID